MSISFEQAEREYLDSPDQDNQTECSECKSVYGLSDLIEIETSKSYVVMICPDCEEGYYSESQVALRSPMKELADLQELNHQINNALTIILGKINPDRYLLRSDLYVIKDQANRAEKALKKYNQKQRSKK